MLYIGQTFMTLLFPQTIALILFFVFCFFFKFDVHGKLYISGGTRILLEGPNELIYHSKSF